MGIRIQQIQQPVFICVYKKIPPGDSGDQPGWNQHAFLLGGFMVHSDKEHSIAWYPGLTLHGEHGLSMDLQQLYVVGATFIISILQREELRFREMK